ncbi:GDYXXLXY domain-containing protein [Allomesorhizobium alhagi]|jgi:uncharacterized membrane-anchored protein|uniref:Membrane-anchored protein n=1 Tax=Mesorhizobium alhagi CCNWXJ12-2 TaxID=1107882 RepID=H0HWI7_9HYPH|nr:hypothetical protein MAXJ12_22740 [Mesorhizobium alhagi CCNWXJ12-2]
MKKHRLLISAILLALLQIGFLSFIIAGRAAVLRDGQEVLLKVEPVDPRDLLRGDYVRLGYDISNIPVSMIGNVPSGAQWIEAGPVFVRVKKDGDGIWKMVSASLYEPPSTPPGDDEIDIRGMVDDGRGLGRIDTLNVEYGIERFYLPEGEGLAIERDMRVRSFNIVAAIAGDGSAQIKALMDGDTMLFREPLY